MPAPATVAEFLELVRKSGLAPENKLSELLGRHRATGSPQTVDQAAAHLVRDAQLTFFQAKQLKLGRYKRFTIGSKYRLLELIGAGGMGAVYLCEHTLMRRLVALKVLPKDKSSDQSNQERPRREGRADAALKHPNIVTAHDVDQFEDLHFLVMEYVDGHSLQEIVARYAQEKRAYDPIRAAHYIAQAAVGMQHAHELGMVHRDIKPGNLLLDRTGVIKVLDMGLARFFNKQQDSVTEKYDEKCVLGTADYLAPEQAVSNVVDVRADIYSLGGTLYFMLTGHAPFPDGTIAAKLVAHQTREPRPVEAFRSDVPAGILEVLARMMAKSPDERYQQPIEVAEALADWAGEPIAPPPEREMPVLCPMVQAMLGPPSDRSAAQAPLSHALFGAGRGVFHGGNSGSVRSRTETAKADATTASNAAFPVPPASVLRAAPAKSGGSARSTPAQPLHPIATAAANGTVPGQGNGAPRARLASAQPAAAPPPGARARGRAWLFVGVGFCVALLCVGVAVIALQTGGDKPVVPTNPNAAVESAFPDHIETRDPTPRQSDTPLPVREAAGQIGKEHTVEFRVGEMEGTTDLSLHAAADPNGAEPFTVRIAEGYFAVPPPQARALIERTKKQFADKLIRARGIIRPNPTGPGYVIEVRVPKQIMVLNDR